MLQNKMFRSFLLTGWIRVNAVLVLFFVMGGVHAVENRTILPLDESCSVNILNRTIQANEFGRFALPNIPSFMGQVRARATCVRNGLTITGQTDYFSVVNNDTIDVGRFYIAKEETLPSRLEITNSLPISIQDVAVTEQLIVNAHYVDETVVDVSAASNGINYQSSNPAVVIVSANGALTGVSSGNALITVRKDGVIAVVNVIVSLGGDRDGDGLPDDYEVAEGLDPADPIDAMEDQDKDGLTALEEYNLGTKVNVADTDGDGILDGEEVVVGTDGFETNPLLADSDSDGLNDSLEIAVGSNPTDNTSANYKDALVSLDVTPGTGVLFYNTIDTETSVQLTVTGTMIDGSEVNLTSKSRGTNYSSSDLAVLNFSIEDGRIFAGTDGTASITVTNNTITKVIQLSVLTFTPRPLGYIQLPATGNNVDVVGTTAYVATKNGLSIIDVSDAKNPYELSNLNLGVAAVDVKSAQGYVYLATANGLVIVNALDTKKPVVVTTLATGDTKDIAIENNLALVATGAQGLQSVDISSPQSAQILGSLVTGTDAKSVAIESDMAVVIDGNSVIAVGVSNPASPVEWGRVDVAGARQVAIKGRHAFIAAHSGSYYPSVDFTLPVTPVVNATSPDFIPYDVAISGDHAFYAEQVFPSAIPIVNIKNPNNPLYQALINMSQFGDYDCTGIAANLNYTFCTARNRLYIAQYRELTDIAGIAPTVTWEKPAFGNELFQGRPYRVSATATDDVRVATVNFYANDELVHTDAVPPYTFVYKVPADSTGLVMRAEAIDLASNVGTSGLIDFVINPLAAIDENWNDIVIDYFTDDLIASSVSMDKATFISNFKLSTTGDFLISGAGNSAVVVDELNVGGDLIIDGVTLTVNSNKGIQVLGNLRLLNGGKLTVPTAVASTKKVYSLNLDVAGAIQIDATSSIDVSGKGYPANLWSGPDFTNNTRYGCHAGKRSNSSANCAYGRVDKAKFAGSAGYAQGSGAAHGGGLIQIKSTSVDVAGSIKTDGAKGRYDYGGGAGGGIHIETELLTGAGSISVRGETYYAGANNHTAGGGRISIYSANTSGFTGEYKTGTGGNGRVSGAGTAYIKDPSEQYGHLYISNAGRTAPGRSTKLRQVGRRAITAIESIGNNQWKVTVAGTPWKVTNNALDWGLQGLEVSLDASKLAGARYPIISNTTNELIIESTDDLTSSLGNELVGIHTFQSVTITGGAWLDLGADRIFVLEVSNSSINAGATISAGRFQQEIIELALTSGGGIVSSHPIHVPELTAVSTGSSNITAPELIIDGNMTLDGMTLVLGLDKPITIGGDLILNNNAVLTTRYASSGAKKIYDLNLEVAGNITIDSTSKIDLNGKGYPAHRYSGPDFVGASVGRYGCHAGQRSEASGNCTYGRYEHAKFAGSAGYAAGTGNAKGGGVASIKASSITLNGVISANGNKGNHTYGGGAGGGVHLDISTLSGAGRIESIGATYYAGGGWHTGSGGRISVYVDDRSAFTGNFIAKSDSTGKVSGAGTVYIKDGSQSYGHLSIDNGGRRASASSTPLRSVGRHTITDVYEESVGVWKVIVDGTPWKATDIDLQWGLDGIDVDLDQSETASTHYSIISNTTNEITLHTTDDLSGYIGSVLAGVHTFQTLNISGGAAVLVDGDRIVVNDLANSTVGTSSRLTVGSLSQSLIEIAGAGGGRLDLQTTPNLSSLNLSNLSGSTLVFYESVSIDTMTIGSGKVYFSGGLTVSGDLTINNGAYVSSLNLSANNLTLDAASLNTELLSINNDISIVNSSSVTVPNASSSAKRIYELNIVAGGTVTLDDTSIINLKGKGYPAHYYAGPDFNNNQVRYGCYGGKRSNTGSDSDESP